MSSALIILAGWLIALGLLLLGLCAVAARADREIEDSNQFTHDWKQS